MGSVSSRKANLSAKSPSLGFQDIHKRRLLTLCSDGLKLRNFQRKSELSNGRCPTGYRMSLLCLFGTSFAYSIALTRVYLIKHSAKVLLYSAWASALSVLFPKAMRRPQSVERQQSDPRFFIYLIQHGVSRKSNEE